MNSVLHPIVAKVVWEPVFPISVILVLGFVLVGVSTWSYLKVAKRIPSGRRWFLLFLRLLAIAAILVFLAQPFAEEKIPRVIAERIIHVLLDTSKSMAEPDAADQSRRLDAAKALLSESGLLDGDSDFADVRISEFDDGVRPLPAGEYPVVEAKGETTRIHSAITEALADLRGGESSEGVFLFTDGHDFERTPVSQTAQVALSAKTPIYPVPFGKQQIVPDISVQLTSSQSHTFVRQEMRIGAAVRLTGGGPAALRVDLVREDEVIETRRVSINPGTEEMVSFSVSEDGPGQFEYLVRASSIPGERELKNNVAFTFMNVTDARIPVLLLEGAPHWDSTFLKRTLAANERIELTSVMLLAPDKPVLWTNADSDPVLPKAVEEFSAYPLIITGREIDRILPPESVSALGKAVSESGVTLLLARGRPGSDKVFDELAPADWTEGAAGPVTLNRRGSKGSLVPIDLLESAPGGIDSLPLLPIARHLSTPKTLAAIEAMATDSEAGTSVPAFVHRRFERGQVLAVSVGGLWRWSLNGSSEPTNNLYDRFWNQLLLNLISRSGVMTSDTPQIHVSSANLSLGQQASFTLFPGKKEIPGTSKEAVIYRDDEAVGRVTLTNEGRGSWRGAWLPTEPGRYRVALPLDDDLVDCRFAVIREDREIVEVSPDYVYLQRLADLSGGEVLDSDGLADTLERIRKTIAAESDAPPEIRKTSLWDRVPIFYLLFSLLGLEWFLRRRWGMT